MIRTFAALLFLSASTAAFAVCPSPLTGKDGGGTSQNFGVTVDGSGNCYGNIAIVDGTAAANKATVKAASTAAVATDTALVVAVSPNNTIAATQSGPWNVTNISGAVSLPTGAATSALQTTGNTALTTINTTLGSPFQAGGSIGNTSFAVTQATAGNLNGLMGGIAGSSVTMQNAATGTGNGTTLTTTNFSTALLNVSISVSATVVFEGTDSTGTYFSIQGIPVTGGSAGVSSVTASGQYWVPVAGLTTIRARISVYGSGSVTVTGTPVYGTNALTAQVANAITAVGNNGDGVSATASCCSPVVNYPAGFTGSGWDRQYTIGNQTQVDVAQTVTASSAYTSGNAVGGLMTIANAARVSGSVGASGTSGIVQNVAVNSKSVQSSQMDIFIFNANPTSSTCTDKTAFVLATADFNKVIGVISVPSTVTNNNGWFSGGTGSVGQANNQAMAYSLSSATSLFACMVTRGTPTFTATSDISVKFQMLRG